MCTCFIVSVKVKRKEMVLFNDALQTSHLWSYGVGNMVKDLSNSETENPLPPLLFLVSSKGSFIRTIPHTGLQLWNTAWNKK